MVQEDHSCARPQEVVGLRIFRLRANRPHDRRNDKIAEIAWWPARELPDCF